MRTARNFASHQESQKSRRIPQTGKQNRKPIKCPFYGLTHPVGHTFIDRGNAQCALLVKLGLCKMKVRGVVVDWGNCLDFNTKENEGVLDVIIGKYNVLPRGQADTVPLKDWLARVMEK